MKPPFVLLLFLIGIHLSGCGVGSSSRVSYWTAHRENGDKPGIGYVLTVQGDGILAGKFYIMDPNKPGDFGAGVDFDFANITNIKTGATFTLPLPDKTNDSFYLLMDHKDLNSNSMEIFIKDTTEPDSKLFKYIFTPTPNPPPTGLSLEEYKNRKKASAPAP